MSFFYAWLSLGVASLLATMVPGAAFAVVLRNSISVSRRAGILTAAGLGMGLAVHAALVIFGIGAIILKTKILYALIRWGGAFYLIYLGASCFRPAPSMQKAPLLFAASGGLEETSPPLEQKFLWQGFLTNVMNPKVILFFLALFMQFLSPDMPLHVSILYGLSVMVIEFIWFSLVAVFLTHPWLKELYQEKTHWIERTSGAVLVFLGFFLIGTSLFL